MTVKLAIADSNKEYVNRLLNGLEKYDDIILSAYTDKNNLEAALSSKHFDVLLFNPELYYGQTELDKNTLAIMLFDSEQRVTNNLQEYKKLNKYQRISSIHNQVYELYSEICGNIGGLSGQQKAASIAFYSPIGGAGKTTLALVTASKLALNGYRTLYVNFEDFSSEGFYLPQNAERGMSQIVASLGENVNISMKIQGLLQTKTDNLYYIKHFDSPNDLYEIKEDEIVELISQLINSGLFDCLVIDMGGCTGKKALCIFDITEQIVVITKPDEIAMNKMEQFTHQAHIMNEYGKKMVGILNFDNGRKIQTDIPLIGKVPAIAHNDSEQLVSGLINSSAGNFAEKLLRK